MSRKFSSVLDIKLNIKIQELKLFYFWLEQMLIIFFFFMNNKFIFYERNYIKRWFFPTSLAFICLFIWDGFINEKMLWFGKLFIIENWKNPNFILFIKGWWTCSESTLHRLSFPAYFLYTDRPAWSGRLGVQNFVWDSLAWLDCMDSVGWQGLAGFRSARKFYTRLEKAASWNRYPPGFNFSLSINKLKDWTLENEIGLNIWEKKNIFRK